MATTNEILTAGFTAIVEKLSLLDNHLQMFYTNLKADLTLLYQNLHTDNISLLNKLEEDIALDRERHATELEENELLISRHTDIKMMIDDIDKLIHTIRGTRDFNSE